MKLYDNQVREEKGPMVIDDYHCVKDAKLSLIRVFVRIDKTVSVYCDSVHMRENTYQRKPVFWHILRSVKHSFSRV